MTDHDRPAPGPFDEHPDVTALLAGDPAPPIPDDVAARLQAALREESDARATRDRPRVVTPIEAANRRRLVVRRLAVAAVAVVVVGVGGTALVRTSGQGAGSESASAGAGASADRETLGAESAAPDQPGTLAQPDASADGDSGGAEGRRLADPQEAVDTDQAPAALASRPGSVACTDDRVDVASSLAVSYEGDLAWLITLPAADGADRQFVVYRCTDGTAQQVAVVQPRG